MWNNLNALRQSNPWLPRNALRPTLAPQLLPFWKTFILLKFTRFQRWCPCRVNSTRQSTQSCLPSLREMLLTSTYQPSLRAHWPKEYGKRFVVKELRSIRQFLEHIYSLFSLIPPSLTHLASSIPERAFLVIFLFFPRAGPSSQIFILIYSQKKHILVISSTIVSAEVKADRSRVTPIATTYLITVHAQIVDLT